MKKLNLSVLILSLILMVGVRFNAIGQASELTAPAGTPWIWSDYVDPSIPDDKVFIFCSPDENGNTVLGSLSVTGGSATCQYLWGIYDEDPTSPTYQQFVTFLSGPVPVGPGSTVTDLTSGFYQVVITCNPGTPSQTVYCRRAHVFVNESIVDFNPIPAGCQPFTITGGIIGAVSDFTIYDPPATPFNVGASTNITVCFWINHSYVSDLGFYLIGPNGARVDLLPPVSAWDQPGVTNLNPNVLPNPCATTALNTSCNSGNNYNNFCFTSGLPAGNPAFTACICSMSSSTPITGTFASAESWAPIYGQSAANGGWAVQIFDCFAADVGSLQRVTITFDGQGECGNATYSYDSGPINVTINDASCDSATAATYTVPLKTTSHHTITNEVTAHWESFPTPWNPAWGSTDFAVNPTPVINPEPIATTQYKLVIEDHLYDALGNEIPTNSNYIPCAPFHSETYITLPADASVINIPDELCINSNGIQLQAQYPNGTWSSASCGVYNPAAGQFGCLTPGGYFFPSLANIGPNTITHAFGGVCADDTTFIINIVDAPIVIDIVDTLCNSLNTQFKVQITLSGGNPGGYSFTNCTNNLPVPGTLNGNIWTSNWMNSPANYCIKVTDNNDCNPQVINGFHDCGCESQSATMPQAVQELCVYESANVTHNNNYHLDANDTWEYILHTEPFGFLGTVLGRNTTGIFYFNSTSMTYNTTYYISHVVGNNMATPQNPVVNINDPCLSVSPGTPVRWFENPSPDAGLSVITCGNIATLAAAPPTVGQGAWSAMNTFGVIYSPNFASPGTAVTIPNFDTNQYGCPINTNRTFRWTVTNGPCTQFDDVVATFKPLPNAFAGVNASVCGLQTTMAAQYSICGPQGVSEGYWSGSGQFQNQLSPTSVVNVYQPGCYDFIWTEFNDECSSSSYVNLCFIQNPVVDANFNDSVCGLQYNLSAISTMGTGNWTGPANSIFTAQTNPQSMVQISMPAGVAETVATFTWTEQNTGPNGLICTSSDNVNITFSLTPNAAAGLDDEVCGNIYTFDADVFGFEYALGTWKTNFVGANFSNVHYPGSSVTIPNTGVMPGQPNNGTTFGDSSWVTVPFTWVMDNNKCTDEDDVLITFYQKPIAKAGPDTSVCGKTYVMKGAYSIGQSKGEWTMVNGPSPLQPNWTNKFSPTSSVTVAVSGTYTFRWKEDNFHNPSCSAEDFVTITFIEIPDVNAGSDRYICGTTFTLEASASTGNGVWLPNSTQIITPSDPHSVTNIGSSSSNQTIIYVWQEYNSSGGVQCVSNDTVNITFMVQPSANVLWTPGVSLDHVCGKKETNVEQIIVGQNPSIVGPNIQAYWVGNDAEFYKGGIQNPYARDPDSVVVNNYGIHYFNWIIENWVGDSVCRDTSDITIIVDFIEQPKANAGPLFDTACGHYYQLGSQFSTTTGDSTFGKWITTSPNQIEFVYLLPMIDTLFIDQNTPIFADSLQWVNVHLNNAIDLVPPPVYTFIWQETNYGELGDFCTDQATTTISFAPKPTGRLLTKEAGMHPPHCIGTEAKIKAADDVSIINWDWSDLGGGVITSVEGGGTISNPGIGPLKVKWPNAVAKEVHIVRLITENVWGCNSPSKADTIIEPDHVPVEIDPKPAYCGEPNGEISLNPLTSALINNYGWVPDTLSAPAIWTAPTADKQINLETGDYLFWARAKSLVTPNPDNIYCRDTFMVHVGDTGYIAAMWQLSSVLDTTGVAPHQITLNNISYMVDSNYVSPGYINAVAAASGLPPVEQPDADYLWRFYRIPLDSIFDWYAPIIIKPSDLPVLVGKDEIIEDESPVMTFEIAGFYYWEMIATSEYGCKDTIVGGYVKTEGYPMLTPGVNVMTPNGDGINDLLEFEAQSLRSMEGVILNRWGQKIYEWTWNEEEQEPVPGWWDGKLSSGQDAPPGVYYYVIKGVGQKDQDFSGKEYSGFFHLIREK